jgi:hypothetical protein
MLLCRVPKEVLEAVVGLLVGILVKAMAVKEALDKDKISRTMDMVRAKEEVTIAGEEAILGEGEGAGETGKLLRINRALAAFRA